MSQLHVEEASQASGAHPADMSSYRLRKPHWSVETLCRHVQLHVEEDSQAGGAHPADMSSYMLRKTHRPVDSLCIHAPATC